jgi:hypothetical protein
LGRPVARLIAVLLLRVVATQSQNAAGRRPTRVAAPATPVARFP